MCPFAFEEQSYYSNVLVKHFQSHSSDVSHFHCTLYLLTLCTLSHNVVLKKNSVFMFVSTSVGTVQKGRTMNICTYPFLAAAICATP